MPPKPRKHRPKTAATPHRTPMPVLLLLLVRLLVAWQPTTKSPPDLHHLDLLLRLRLTSLLILAVSPDRQQLRTLSPLPRGSTIGALVATSIYIETCDSHRLYNYNFKPQVHILDSLIQYMVLSFSDKVRDWIRAGDKRGGRWSRLEPEGEAIYEARVIKIPKTEGHQNGRKSLSPHSKGFTPIVRSV